MSRYIDADTLEREGWKLHRNYQRENAMVYETKSIQEIPTAQPEPPCNTCRYRDLEWDEEPCDSCMIGGEKSYYTPSAQPEQQWTSCSERLPEEIGYYLVTLARDLEVDISYFTKYNTWETFRNTEVIAWLPLPDPYKG